MGAKVYADESENFLAAASDGANSQLQSLPLADYLEVGIFGKSDEEEELYLLKHKIVQIHNKLAIVVDRQPTFAGIDPYGKLIDTNARDNRMKIAVVDFGNR